MGYISKMTNCKAKGIEIWDIVIPVNFDLVVFKVIWGSFDVLVSKLVMIMMERLCNVLINRYYYGHQADHHGPRASCFSKS